VSARGDFPSWRTVSSAVGEPGDPDEEHTAAKDAAPDAATEEKRRRRRRHDPRSGERRDPRPTPIEPHDGPTVPLVDTVDGVAEVVAAVRAAPLVAFDLEFLSADRLNPALCLLQVSWLPPGAPLDAPPEPTVALVDPAAIDARELVETLAAHPMCIAHAARQDLWILAARFGIAFPNLIDTQVMAAFAGLGDQVGYASIVGETLGIPLDKGSQWTDWARRPLSPSQLTYATADVLHLPAVYAVLVARLGSRLAWARAESAEVAAAGFAAAQTTEDTAWEDINTRGLDADAVGAVMALAAWRFRVAVELDRPLGQVMNERTMLDLIRARPDSPSAIRSIKGISPLARMRAEAIHEALVAAAPATLPMRAISRAPSARAQRWADLLLAIAQLVAEQAGVAVRLLATRSDAEDIARLVDEGAPVDTHRIFATWRGAVLGVHWRGWLAGTTLLAGDPASPNGLRLVTP